MDNYGDVVRFLVCMVVILCAPFILNLVEVLNALDSLILAAY